MKNLRSMESSMIKCPRWPRIPTEYPAWRPRKNPKSRVLRLPRIMRRQLDDIVYLPELPRKRRNQRRRETLSHLNRSTSHPATGITPSQEGNISETIQLSYL